mmetsp:Transcript_97810/g.276684  ORF Transcript_97810/g.276684 Transcript_97810/m.276684 type:complete len:335 (-) Transcript_97810:80-1084(-)
MAGADAGDVRNDEDRRGYFREIGLEATESRIKMLERRANSLRRNKGAGGGARRDVALAGVGAAPAVSTTSGIAAPSPAPAQSSLRTSASTAVGSILPVLHEEPRTARGGAATLNPSEQGSSLRKQRVQAATAALPASPAHQQLREEMEFARRELKERVQKYREEFLELEWKQHWEVSLLQRPTSAEQEDPTLRHFLKYRRPHQKVVIGRDNKEIQGMPNHNLCINDGLKRSIAKMRENLFHRRLNLAIYEKTISEWSLPQLRAEARRRGRKARDGQRVQGRGAQAGTYTGVGAAASAGKNVSPAVATVDRESPTIVVDALRVVGGDDARATPNR